MKLTCGLLTNVEKFVGRGLRARTPSHVKVVSPIPATIECSTVGPPLPNHPSVTVSNPKSPKTSNPRFSSIPISKIEFGTQVREVFLLKTPPRESSQLLGASDGHPTFSTTQVVVDAVDGNTRTSCAVFPTWIAKEDLGE